VPTGISLSLGTGSIDRFAATPDKLDVAALLTSLIESRGFRPALDFAERLRLKAAPTSTSMARILGGRVARGGPK
jgi:hypothetical protein